MLYHKIDTNDFLKIFYNLEELTCLSFITQNKCTLEIPFDWVKNVFDLSNFEVVDKLPDDLSECDISDFVCMYDIDIEDIEGSEFLFYYPNQKGSFMRLDKFKTLDFKINFVRSNFYESKYFTSNPLVYKIAINRASSFDINSDFKSQFEYLKNTIQNIPLLCLDGVDLNNIYNFDFKECFYVYKNSDMVQRFLLNNNIIGYDIKQILYNFNIVHQQYDINLLIYLCKDIFFEIYGCPNDLLFNSLLKSRYKIDSQYEPKILSTTQSVVIDKYQIKNVNPGAKFSFVQKNFQFNRSLLLSFLRFRECINS